MEKLVPKLRFPEFEGNWERKKTIDIAPLQRGFDLPTSDVVEGDYPVVYSNGILRSHNNFKVKAPGVVTGRSGTIGKVTYVEKDYWPHNTSLWVTDFKNNNPKFIFYFYSIFNLDKYNAGSTVPTLNRNDVHNIKKIIPQPEEQQKIATFLTSVDERLTLLAQQKEKLELYKKGVMQQIFAQKLLFKDEKGNNYPDWEEKKLGDLGNTFNGLTGKTKEHFGNGKPYVQYMQIFSGSKININDFGFVEIGKNENQSMIQYGDIFFTTSSETPNEIGTTSVLLDKVGEVYLNSFCFGFRPNSLNELVPEFAQFLFRSKQMRNKIVPLAQGSTRFNMSKVELMKIDLLLPCEEEQQKIASFLSAIDVQIEGVSKKIEQTKLFKKGLLQQLFV